MSLHHVLYVSYLAPEALPLAVFDRDNAFVSVVTLQSTGVRLSSLPFPEFTYNQGNIRTYVLDPRPGQQAILINWKESS
jgi:uncharacterized protein YqjF (DUF2071 family)